MKNTEAKQSAMRDRQATKRCNRCTRTKLVTEFYKGTGYADGHWAKCKDCVGKRNAAYKKSKRATLPQERAAIEAEAQAVSDEIAFLVAPVAVQEAVLAQGEENKHCECAPRNICAKCGAVMDGPTCRFCYSKDRPLRAHEVDCPRLGIFGRIDTRYDRAPASTANYSDI